MKIIRKTLGFTLIEILIFIVVTGMLLSTMLLAMTTALRNAPTVHQQWIALESARKCMEWFLESRRLQGYASLSCPSTPSSTICAPPSGYTASISVACTTWNSDTSFKTITVNITGLAPASLTVQIGDY